MDIQNVDGRLKKEIIRQIKEKAPSYVPEWRFDEEFPDIGSALAMVYADMLSKTLKKLNQVLLKNRIAFLNELNANLLPAIPASGYVTFSLVNEEVDGVEIAAGTMVSAQSDDDEIGIIHYQTLDDIYVTPANLSIIYQTSDQHDFISKIYQRGQPEGEIPLFDLSKGNMQKHELYFCHQEAFYIKESGWVYLEFFLREDKRVSEEMMERLADKTSGRFEYYAEGGYLEFQSQAIIDGCLCLKKGEEQPEMESVEVGGTEGYFVRYRVLDMNVFRLFGFERLMIRTKGINIIPDSVYANGIESNRKHYFPFGERITTYSEVYFASKEALCKKNAAIELTFNLEFVKIPLDYNIENDPVKWEWIMKRSDFKPDLEYDVTIDTVIWEYYNGTGWARLFSDERYGDVFLPGDGGCGAYKKIEFICPQDMTIVTVNSCESYYIRARIVKVNNLFKMKGAYLTPVLDNTIFGYDYQGHEVRPERLVSYNNLEMRQLRAGQPPFEQVGENRMALYLGFDTAPLYGPLKFFFKIKAGTDWERTGLLWEYYSDRGWKEVNLADETLNFSKSGIVTLMGSQDFAGKALFGESRFWIRVTDIKGGYSQKDRKRALPVVQGIHLNTTKIMNVDKEVVQYFAMEVYKENMRFVLNDIKIIKARVLVNEIDSLGDWQLQELDLEKRLRRIYDDQGLLKEAWICWDCVEDFMEAGPGDRCCIVDKNEGAVIFGDGIHGRIPPSSGTENICVEYMTGGGSHTNVKPGMVRQLDRGIGFINRIYNPEKLMGGCDMESMEAALIRSSAAIRHQLRAITVRDYEEIAMAASRSISRVKCFAGYDADGQRSLGSITLVVLQKHYEDGELQFHAIKNDIERHLMDKMSGDLPASQKIAIIGPKFVELRVRAEISVRDFNSVFQAKKHVLERLNQFLDPLSGNFNHQGWEIGSLPNHIQIKNTLSDIPEVVFIRNIYITAFSGELEGWKEVDLGKMMQNRYILPVGGKHEVIVCIL